MLSRTANSAPSMTGAPGSINWRDTRGGLFIRFDYECNKNEPTLTHSIIIDNPGWTRQWLTTIIEQAEGIAAEAEVIDIPDKNGKVIKVKSHSRLASFSAAGGRLMTNHGIPYIGRRVSFYLRCVCEDESRNVWKPEYFISYDGSPFPSHEAYHKELNVSGRSQSDIESLLFGEEGSLIPLSNFHETDWVVE